MDNPQVAIQIQRKPKTQHNMCWTTQYANKQIM